MTEHAIPSLEEIRRAAARIRGEAVRTPLLPSAPLSEDTGARVFLKPENLQRVGAFKFRGAYNRLAQLTAAEKARGVVAFSSGNHAQGVAAAARILGIQATIVMPSDAPQMKVDNTRSYGAQVVLYDRERESREEIAADLAMRSGATVVPAFEDPHIIAGQGTAALESVEQLRRQTRNPDARFDLFACPVGGGGLISGCSIALRALTSETEIYGVEPAGFDDVGRSLQSGRLERNDRLSGSVCDALLSPSAGMLTWSIIRRNVTGMRAVTDQEALRAVKYAWEKLKLVVEPGGAVALAALLGGKLEVEGKTVCLLLSGGNIDRQTLIRALET